MCGNSFDNDHWTSIVKLVSQTILKLIFDAMYWKTFQFYAFSVWFAIERVFAQKVTRVRNQRMFCEEALPRCSFCRCIRWHEHDWCFSDFFMLLHLVTWTRLMLLRHCFCCCTWRHGHKKNFPWPCLGYYIAVINGYIDVTSACWSGAHSGWHKHNPQFAQLTNSVGRPRYSAVTSQQRRRGGAASSRSAGVSLFPPHPTLIRRRQFPSHSAAQWCLRSGQYAASRVFWVHGTWRGVCHTSAFSACPALHLLPGAQQEVLQENIPSRYIWAVYRGLCPTPCTSLFLFSMALVHRCEHSISNGMRLETIDTVLQCSF